MWIIYDMRPNGLWYAEWLFVDLEAEGAWTLSLYSKRKGGYKLRIEERNGANNINREVLKFFITKSKRQLEKLKLIE